MEHKNSEYFFSYTSSGVFIIAIVIYLYYLILEYKDPEPNRSISKQIWIWTFFVMLFLGFFLVIKL